MLKRVAMILVRYSLVYRHFLNKNKRTRSRVSVEAIVTENVYLDEELPQ